MSSFMFHSLHTNLGRQKPHSYNIDIEVLLKVPSALLHYKNKTHFKPTEFKNVGLLIFCVDRKHVENQAFRKR